MTICWILTASRKGQLLLLLLFPPFFPLYLLLHLELEQITLKFKGTFAIPRIMIYVCILSQILDNIN